MPALLLLVLAVIQFGLWAHAKDVALAAAQDGAQAARSYEGSEQAGRDRATESLDRLGPTILRDPAVAVNRSPEQVTVTVAGSAVSVLGFLDWPVEETAQGAVERFVGGGS